MSFRTIGTRHVVCAVVFLGLGAACGGESEALSGAMTGAAGAFASTANGAAGNTAAPTVPVSTPTARANSGPTPATSGPSAAPAAANIPNAQPMQPSAAAATTPQDPAAMPGGPGVPVATPNAAAAPGAAAAPPAAQPWNTNGTTCLQAGSGQFGEPGPYKVGMMDVDLGMIEPSQTTGKFTIFYPTPLESECKHPIVAWGNGTGVNDSTTYAFFNQNAASWGMVVIASQDPNTGSGAFHKAGIDYMLAQNEDTSSMFYQKLSPRAGTSGHSQGAFGSVAGAGHPNVSVNVGVGGGASTAAQHAALCLTGTEDIAADTCPASADRAQGPFFAASWDGGDHVVTETIAGYIQRDPGALAMQRLYAAWFRCYLADDGVACNLFKGGTPNDCGLCKEGMNWAVLKANNVQ